MEEKKQNINGFNWKIFFLPLIALFLIVLTIATTYPEHQFMMGLLSGMGAGLLLTAVYSYFSQRR